MSKALTVRMAVDNPGPLDPFTPEEVARVAAEGCACGASAFHPIRVRMPDGTNKAAGCCASCMDALKRKMGVVVSPNPTAPTAAPEEE